MCRRRNDGYEDEADDKDSCDYSVASGWEYKVKFPFHQ